MGVTLSVRKTFLKRAWRGAVCTGCRAAWCGELCIVNAGTVEITGATFHYNIPNGPLQHSELQYPAPASSAWMGLYLVRSGFLD